MNNESLQIPSEPQYYEELDCIGHTCPMPVIMLAQKMNEMPKNKVLKMMATDPNTNQSVPTWCINTQNKHIAVIITRHDIEGIFVYNHYIRKV